MLNTGYAVPKLNITIIEHYYEFISVLTENNVAYEVVNKIVMSQCMRFPTMWYVRSAKPQISLRIRAV